MAHRVQASLHEKEGQSTMRWQKTCILCRFLFFAAEFFFVNMPSTLPVSTRNLTVTCFNLYIFKHRSLAPSCKQDFLLARMGTKPAVFELVGPDDRDVTRSGTRFFIPQNSVRFHVRPYL